MPVTDGEGVPLRVQAVVGVRLMCFVEDVRLGDRLAVRVEVLLAVAEAHDDCELVGVQLGGRECDQAGVVVVHALAVAAEVRVREVEPATKLHAATKMPSRSANHAGDGRRIMSLCVRGL